MSLIAVQLAAQANGSASARAAALALSSSNRLIDRCVGIAAILNSNTHKLSQSI